jgi:hypothetical protein
MRRRRAGTLAPGGQDVLAVDFDVAARGLVKQIQAAQEGALAGAGGPDDGDDLALVDLDIDILEDFQITKTLGEMFDPDHADFTLAAGEE